MKTESVNAKKLHQGRSFSYQKIQAYQKRFIDKKTGRHIKKLVQSRACPVCDSKRSEVIFNKGGGDYVKCLNCTMVYVNPAFTLSALSQYYGGLDTGQPQITANESPFYSEIYTLGLKTVEAYSPPATLLDVGCSSGFFLDIAKQRGWETAGVELSRKESKLARGKGHVIYNDRLEHVKLKNTFDAITLWDVFEHQPDGKRQLVLLKNLLRPNGLLFLQIPNADALAAKMMRAECKMFDTIEHVNLYNPKTITALAKAGGWEVVAIRSVISEIAVLNNYLSYQDPYFGSSDYGTKLLDCVDENFIHQNLLGYKLQVLLRPKK